MFPQPLILTLLLLTQLPPCRPRPRAGLEVGYIDILDKLDPDQHDGGYEQDTGDGGLPAESFDRGLPAERHIQSWHERTKKENCNLYDYPNKQYCDQHYPNRYKSQIIYKNEDHLLIAWLILIIMMFVVYICIYF